MHGGVGVCRCTVLALRGGHGVNRLVCVGGDGRNLLCDLRSLAQRFLFFLERETEKAVGRICNLVGVLSPFNH